MSSTKDFKIEKGILMKYTGPGGDVTIPDGVTSIGGSAFWGCTSLTSLTIPDGVTSIGQYAFEYCEKLTSVTIPDGVTRIGSEAFRGCSSLTGVTIPDSVTEIDTNTFTGCKDMQINASESAFNVCWKVVEDEVKKRYVNDYLKSGSGPKAVAQYIKRKKEYYLSEIIKEDSVEKLTVLMQLFKKPDIAMIDEYLQKAENTVNIKAFLIDYKAKGFSQKQVSEYYDDRTEKELGFKEKTLAEWRKIFKIVDKDGKRYITGYKATDPIVIIPANIAGKPVYGIGEKTFAGNSVIDSVVIEQGVEIIDSSAFEDCTGLTSVTVPDGVTSIGNKAFEGTKWYKDQPNGIVFAGKVLYKYKGKMPKDTVIKIPDSVKSIVGSAFSGCTELTSVTIPESVTEIGWSAFSGCKKLTSVTIPDGVTEIGWGAFEGCTGLTSVVIPDSVTSIGEEAFEGCKKLTSVTIPDGVTSIGGYAFEDCTSLTSVTIPDSVTGIGRCAFYNCMSLTGVTIPGSVTSVGDCAFRGCENLTSVTIPNAGTEIGTWAFAYCENLTLIGAPDSFAMKHAKGHHIPFKAI